MKRIVRYEFDEKDIKLLNKKLPDNPCTSCPNSKYGNCCGCDNYMKYVNTIKPYEEAEILEFAIKLKEIDNKKKIIIEKEKEIKDLESEIPQELIGILYK